MQSEIEQLKSRIKELERENTWLKFSEKMYVDWCHRLLINGYEGAKKIRERLEREEN